MIQAFYHTKGIIHVGCIILVTWHRRKDHLAGIVDAYAYRSPVKLGLQIVSKWFNNMNIFFSSKDSYTDFL